MSEHKKVRIGLFITIPLLIASLGFLIWGYNEYKTLEAAQVKLGEEKVLVETRLKEKTEERDYIFSQLTAEQQKNITFENQIKDITSQVGTLDKLSKTDKELLQKYSKVYFLNEHYIPEKLAEIPKKYLYQEERIQHIHQNVLSFLETMINDAERDNVSLEIISAYRSFNDQTSLKAGYKVTYGAGTANQFSADQGYSEHQLGTAIDLTTEKLGLSFGTFNKTDSYTWMKENAYKYGFIISYPEGNAYYQFEPWHWRFVGKKLAEKMHIEGESFYDMDQRIIDNYLINIFD